LGGRRLLRAAPIIDRDVRAFAGERMAIAWPMPDDAPVIKTFLPFKRSMLAPCTCFIRRSRAVIPAAPREYSSVAPDIGVMQITRRFVLVFGLTLMPALAGSPADPVNKNGGVAIKGYDAVAYFTDSKPVKGSPSFTHQWNGATWQFATAEHRDAFAKSPEKFAPQYGGYCAYGVSQNHTAPIDPEAWTVLDGKLFLNNSQSVKKTWSQSIPKYIEEADKNWPGLHK
jgi:YHS domain-containing protein